MIIPLSLKGVVLVKLTIKLLDCLPFLLTVIFSYSSLSITSQPPFEIGEAPPPLLSVSMILSPQMLAILYATQNLKA